MRSNVPIDHPYLISVRSNKSRYVTVNFNLLPSFAHLLPKGERADDGMRGDIVEEIIID